MEAFEATAIGHDGIGLFGAEEGNDQQFVARHGVERQRVLIERQQVVQLSAARVGRQQHLFLLARQ